MRPAAPGLRAAPSQAAAPILDWPNAPPTTAIAKPTPAAIALTPLALAVAASAVCGCAKTDVAAIKTATAAIKNKPIFLMVISSNLAKPLKPRPELFRPHPVSTAPLTTALQRYRL